MAHKPKLPPLFESVQHLKELFDIDDRTAINDVQSTYEHFKRRNEAQVTTQNAQQNVTRLQLISHFALLATLTLTVAGFLLTQTNVHLTDMHKVFVLLILLSETISLFFGAFDYIQTIAFHQRWAEVCHSIRKEVDKKFESAALQWTNDMNKIESKYLSNEPTQTKMWVTYCTVAF